MSHMLGFINGHLCKKKWVLVGNCDSSIVLESTQQVGIFLKFTLNF
jgi:hypothetical protein